MRIARALIKRHTIRFGVPIRASAVLLAGKAFRTNV